MPNGGYPMHLVVLIGSDFALYISGSSVSLRRLVDDGRGQGLRWTEELGTMSVRQTAAVLHHLAYWGMANHGADIRKAGFAGVTIQPGYQVGGCIYDY